MEEKYGDDLVTKSSTLKLKTGGATTSLVTYGPRDSTTQKTNFKDIDLMSLLKILPLIASEMDIDTLSKNLLKIVIENAGAQKGFLIFLKNNSSESKLIYHIDENGSVFLIDNKAKNKICEKKGPKRTGSHCLSQGVMLLGWLLRKFV